VVLRAYVAVGTEFDVYKRSNGTVVTVVRGASPYIRPLEIVVGKPRAMLRRFLRLKRRHRRCGPMQPAARSTVVRDQESFGPHRQVAQRSVGRGGFAADLCRRGFTSSSFLVSAANS